MIINNLEYILLSAVCLFVGMLLIWFAYNAARSIRKQMTWCYTKGTITKASYNYGADFVYDLALTYTYIVDNVSYTGSKENYFNSFWGNFQDAEKHAGGYRKGDIVNVYYDQELPFKSVLKPEEGKRSVTLLYLIGGAFALIGILIIVTRCVRLAGNI